MSDNDDWRIGLQHFDLLLLFFSDCDAGWSLILVDDLIICLLVEELGALGGGLNSVATVT